MSNVKDMFSKSAMSGLGDKITKVYKDFQTDSFIQAVFTEEWESLELFARMTHIAKVLGNMFAGHDNSFEIIYAVIPDCDMAQGMIFPQYIAVNGLDKLNESAAALAIITQYSSCEFAVRPFIDKYPEQMLEILSAWSKSDNEHIRRLASEGTRLAIPWGSRLQTVKNNPDYAIPILEVLKDDPSEYVRKSVANNLNELSKIAPDLVMKIAGKWINGSKNTQWIVKHACRTLLKQAHPPVMELFGLAEPAGISVKLISVSPEVKLNDDLVFSFEIMNETNGSIKIRIGYDIGFIKSSGKISYKANKISERVCKPGITAIERKHKIFDTSSRKIYPGRHELKITINGCVMADAEFIVRNK
jgi:3-methyladenine DNA glycosylase AlkC